MKNNDNSDTSSPMLFDETKVWELLRNEGVSVDSSLPEKVAKFMDLVRQWNKVAGLVSSGETEALLAHVVDSLSLCGIVKGKIQGARWLDIGSGGGFPAIPVKLALPEVDLVTLERSERKCGFLIKACGDLGIHGVKVIQGSFPEYPLEGEFKVITARAVEKSERVLKHVTRWMPADSLFLVQSGTPEGLGTRFHVERVEDEWQRLGLRRGSVYLLTKLS